jgi:GDP-L-fucose synthase
VVLWGDGHQRRELVYVEDFVRIMRQLVESCDNEIINIGAGEEYSIRHFAKLICAKVGFDFEAVQFDTSKYVGAKSKCLDVRKLKERLPDWGMTPVEVGVERTIEWLGKNM